MLILASTSTIRRKLLHDAGIVHEAVGSGVDEAEVKAVMLGASVEDVALALADAKAASVAMSRSGLVLGADQILSLDNQLHDKVNTREEARLRLKSLRGKQHLLVGGYVLYKDGQPAARHISKTRLTMRDFSDAFLEDYLTLEGEALFSSVGCYRLEGPGALLFSAIEGDYFSILGLDLLWLCEKLRQAGALTR
jgi:septum formation protein